MNKKTIKDFESTIQISAPLDLVSPDTILTNEDYQLVTSLFTIINKYKATNWSETISITEMHSDLLTLQASLANIALKFGTLTSYADGVEEQLKIARSKVRVNARTLKQTYEEAGDAVAITLDDIKDISYLKTESIWKQFEQSRIAANYIKFVYFAIKDYVQILDHTIQRLSRYE